MGLVYQARDCNRRHQKYPIDQIIRKNEMC